MPLGFRASKEEEEIKTVKHIEEYLQRETGYFEKVQDTIHKSIDEIDLLKENITILLGHCNTLIDLEQVRQSVYDKILKEQNKMPSKINLEQLQEGIEMAKKLNQRIGPFIEEIWEELDQLKITETHLLYELEKNRETMKEIDKQAREKQAELIMIRNNFRTSQSILEQVEGKVKRLNYERENRPRIKEKIGF